MLASVNSYPEVGQLANKQVILEKINDSWSFVTLNISETPQKQLSQSSFQQRQAELNDIIELSNAISMKFLKDICSNWFFTLYDHEGNVIYTLNEPNHYFIGLHYNYFWEKPEFFRAFSQGKIVAATCFLDQCPLGQVTESISMPLYTRENDLLCILNYSFFNDAQISDDVKVNLYLLLQMLKERIAARRHLYNYTQSLIEGIRECAVILDNNLNIVQANKHFVQLLQSDEETVLGRPITHWLDAASKRNLVETVPLECLTFRIGREKREIRCSVQSIQPLDTSDNQSIQVMLVLQPQEQKAGIPATTHPFSHIIGKTPEMQRLITLAQRIAQRPSTVLITGESGTGKELLAEGIHLASGRPGNFVPINCGALPKDLLQSELFGYVSGAFTGAQKNGKIGKFQFADKGTLFLDEIGEMPLDMQVTLLRFLQDKTVTPLGSSQGRSVDVRIVAATNRNLLQMVEDGTFREDLYYRLSVIELELPPLRSRADDIEPIARAVVQQLCSESGLPTPSIDKDIFAYLKNYRWPGNVRELRNVMERLLFLSDSGHLTADLIPGHILAAGKGEQRLPKCCHIQDYEAMAVANALEKCGGNISAAARTLGITRTTLYAKMKKYQLAASG